MFTFLNTINSLWKKKAKERRIEIKSLKKDNKRLKKSREKWKNEATKYKHLATELNNELKKNN